MFMPDFSDQVNVISVIIVRDNKTFELTSQMKNQFIRFNVLFAVLLFLHKIYKIGFAFVTTEMRGGDVEDDRATRLIGDLRSIL